jgi:hypothetical protein
VSNKQFPDGALLSDEAQPYSPPPIEAIPTVRTPAYPVRFAAQPFEWTEAEKRRRTGGSEWAVYREVAWHLDRQEVTDCIVIEIRSYQSSDLLLDCTAYEAMNRGRRWGFVQRFPYESYQAARTIALLWLPEARAHVQRSLRLSTRDERELFCQLLDEERHLQMEIRKLRGFYTPYPADTRLETMTGRIGWFKGSKRRLDRTRAARAMSLLCEKELAVEWRQKGSVRYHTPEFLQWKRDFQLFCDG